MSPRWNASRGSHQIVHHILAYIDTTGEGRKLDAADPGPGYATYGGPGVEIADELDSWTPGNKPIRLPDGISRPLPSKCDVIIQVHYRTSGKAEKDRTRIGFYLARKPVKQSYHWANVTAFKFSIPPNVPDYEVKATWFVPLDVELMSMMPHMHQIGRDFRITLTLPTGKTRDLIHISDWDPGWQDTYYLETPMTPSQEGRRSISVIGALRQLGPRPAQSEQAPRRPSAAACRRPTRCASVTVRHRQEGAGPHRGPARRTTTT